MKWATAHRWNASTQTTVPGSLLICPHPRTASSPQRIYFVLCDLRSFGVFDVVLRFSALLLVACFPRHNSYYVQIFSTLAFVPSRRLRASPVPDIKSRKQLENYGRFMLRKYKNLIGRQPTRRQCGAPRVGGDGIGLFLEQLCYCALDDVWAWHM